MYVRNKSSSGKKTRGMASNKGVAVENLRPAGKTSSAKLFHNPPSDPHVLPTAKRLSVSQHFLSEGGGDHRPFSQVVSCPSLSICETRTMAANLALKKMADHVSLGMVGILRRWKSFARVNVRGYKRERSLVFVFRSGWSLFLLSFFLPMLVGRF